MPELSSCDRYCEWASTVWSDPQIRKSAVRILPVAPACAQV